MSEGNGGVENQQVQEQDKVLIQIIHRADGQLELKSALAPAQVVYLFEEMKYRLFAPKQQSPILHSPKGGMMNFVRGGFKK